MAAPRKNSSNWNSSFENQAKELVKFDTFDSILNRGRHEEFKEMLVHSMFGKFECDNPKCKKRARRTKGNDRGIPPNVAPKFYTGIIQERNVAKSKLTKSTDKLVKIATLMPNPNSI